MKHLALAAALLLGSTAVAHASPAKFDLICQGTQGLDHAELYWRGSFDLDAKVVYSPEDGDSKPLIITSDKLLFGDGWVRRSDGHLFALHWLWAGSITQEMVKANCEQAPFTPVASR
jgi:hypothetical protein